MTCKAIYSSKPLYEHVFTFSFSDLELLNLQVFHFWWNVVPIAQMVLGNNEYLCQCFEYCGICNDLPKKKKKFTCG